MPSLYDLMYVVNDSTYVHIVDNETGELLLEGEASDLLDSYATEEYEDCVVMDVNVWENVLTICIEL